MHYLNWLSKDNNGTRYKLSDVDLTHQYFNTHREGIYIIYYLTHNSFISTVYAGQGNIKDRIYAHRNDDRIQRYADNHTLYVAWAEVENYQQDGIEKYLHNTLNPWVLERSPDAQPIQVNLPWS